jgi:hypothetical protein
VLLSHDPSERRVCEPAGLQERIDALVAQAGPPVRGDVCTAFNININTCCSVVGQLLMDSSLPSSLQARAFVRASGTEDAVRVYAEAGTRDAVDILALRVAQVRGRLHSCGHQPLIRIPPIITA